MKSNNRKGFGKGWFLIIYSFIVYFISSGVSSSMNVAAGVLSKSHGWSATLLTSMISLGSLANIVAGVVFGRLAVKKSVKKLSIIALVLYLVAMAGLGSASNLLVFGICLVLSNGLSNGAGYQLSPVLISTWFPRKKGIIMGIVTMGIPLCSGLAAIIYNIGYKAFGEFGGFLPYMILTVIAIFVLILGVSDCPEEKGFLPDNGMEYEKEVVKETKESIWTTKKLLSTPQVWIHGLLLGILLMFAGGIMVQLFPRLIEIGFSEQTATMMMLASGLFALPGSYFSGLLDEKIGARKAAYTSYVFGAVAMILNLTDNTICVWLSLLFIGIVVGGAANWPASLCIEEFGDSFANGYGIIQPLIQVVGAVGPVFFAAIAGVTGSYRLSYVGGAIIMIVGLILFSTMAKPGFVKCEEAKNI